MTPTELADYARQQYNAVNDTFFSNAELFSYAWQAEMKLARHAYVIENTYTDSTVASQQEYAYPTNALAIKRITVAGRKLTHITMTEDDMVTLLNAATTATGEPLHYFTYDEVLYLRPIPATSGDTIKVYTFDEATEITSSSTLNTPTRYHLDLADFVVYKMATKDKNLQLAQFYLEQWTDTMRQVRSEKVRNWNTDGFTGVDGVVGTEADLPGFF